MGTYTGTSIGDTITPYEVSAGVISVPAGSMPSSASDTINGLDGNDDLDGGGSGDIINGGAGDDRIDDGVSGSGQTNHSNTIHGNDGADDILLRIADSGGTNIATNSAYGDAGNDIVSIYYDWGWDTYDDWLGQPPTGSLLLRGGEGNDELGIFCGPDLWIDTSGTTSKIYGDAGNDFLWATALDPNADLSYYPGNNVDTLYGGTGNDKFFVLEAKDVVIENVGEGTDTIIVDQTDYTLPTNVENLTMTYNMQDYPDPDSGWRGTGNALANVITGCDLADTLDGAAGNDTIKGMDGDDTVYGGLNNDTVYGGDGNDWLNGQWGNDIVYGDAGYDTIIGEDGNDKLFGGNDNDWFTAGAGNDQLFGQNGNDEMYGDGEDDTLTGGAGLDKLGGGAGNDVFDYNAVSESKPGAGRDVVLDFVGVGAAAGDRVDLSTIDANTGVGGNQAFAFKGTGAITGAGQMHVAASGTNTLIQANTGGTTAPELEILVKDGAALPSQWVAGDFIL